MRLAKQLGKRILAFILAGALSFAVLSAFEAEAADITEAGPLGDATHYNGLVFDYFQSYGGDIEGALAVGGTSKIGTSGQYDLGGSALHEVMGTYPNANGYPTLLLGGDTVVGRTSGENNINIYGGPFVISDTARYSGASMYTPQGSKTATGSVVDKFFYDQYEQVIRTLNAVNSANTRGQIPLSAFNGWSTSYHTTFSAANLTGNFVPDNLSPARSDVLVINVTDNGLLQINAPHITSAMGGYELIIFNFPRADSAIFSGSSILVDGAQINTSAPIGTAGNATLLHYAERIIWCFPEAQTLQIAGAGIVGSVIAPHALVEANGGSVNGMLIAESFITEGGNELHGFKLNNNFFDLSTGDDSLEGEVVLYKYEEGGSFQEYTLLPGAAFDLYKGHDWPSSDPSPQSYQTDETGVIQLTLDEGDYLFYEVAAPDGYILPAADADRIHRFTIDAHNGVEEPVLLYASNARKLAAARVYKVYEADPSNPGYDPNGDPDVSPHFELYYVSGRASFLVGAYTPEPNTGLILMEDLVEGTYRLVEADPPDGYWPAMNGMYMEFTVEIDDDGSYRIEYYDADGVLGGNLLGTEAYDAGTTTYTASGNAFQNGLLDVDGSLYYVLVTKADLWDMNFPLEGAVFELERSDEDPVSPTWSSYAYHEADNSQATSTIGPTDSFGHFYMYLPEGFYRLVEVTPPTGYESNPEPYYFSVPYGGIAPMPGSLPLTVEVGGADQDGGATEEDGGTGNQDDGAVDQDGGDASQDSGSDGQDGEARDGGDGGGAAQDSGAQDSGEAQDSGAQDNGGVDAAGGTLTDSGEEPGPAAGDAGPAAETGLFLPDSDPDDGGQYADRLQFHRVRVSSFTEIPLLGDGDGGAQADGGPDDGAAGTAGGTDAGGAATGDAESAEGPSSGGDGAQADGAEDGDGSDADGGVENGDVVGADGEAEDGGDAEDAGAAGILPASDEITRELDPDTVPVTVRNEALGKITVIKQSEGDGELLAGAEFALYYNRGDNTNMWEHAATGITDSSGSVQFVNLKPGEYQVLEVKAPEGYEEIVTPEPVTVENSTITQVTIGPEDGSSPDSTGYTFTFLAVNPRAAGGITIEKVDGDTGLPLPDASFDLYRFDDEDHAWKYYATFVSDGNGILSVSPLPYGRYKAVEMTPPDGYVVNAQYDQHEVIFTVSANTNNGYSMQVENYRRRTSTGGGSNNGGSNIPDPGNNWPLASAGSDGADADVSTSQTTTPPSNDNPPTGGGLSAKLLVSGILACAASVYTNNLSTRDDDE